MKLDFSSDNSAISIVEEDFAQNSVSENGSQEDNKMLRAGIKAAQRGDRAEARQLLLRVTETDPQSESAWLWLASISEYPEELLIFLNNVLDINPENERAIEWAKATKSLLAKTFVQRGIEANGQDNRQFARQCFMQAIVHDNRNEMAWLWLASVTDSVEEKTAHLHRVLEINPENETARDSIRSTREKMMETVFEKAEKAAAQGDRAKAEEYLNELFEFNPQHEKGWFLKARLAGSFEEKTACFEKMLEFAPENEKLIEAVRNLKDERAAEFFAKANDAANDGERVQANELLTEVFNQNPHHEDAWILKSRLTDSFEEKIACFEKILEFNPENETAQAGVKLRAMLDGNTSKVEEQPVFSIEENAEQSGMTEHGEPTKDENPSEENFGEVQEFDEMETVSEEAEAENATVVSFEGEMISSEAETQEFSYYAEAEENEQAEMFEAEVSGDSEDFAAGENAEEYVFENEDVQFAENTADESGQEFFDSEQEEPEEVFAEDSEESADEDFAGNEENSSDVYEIEAAEAVESFETSENGFHAEMPEAQKSAEENNSEIFDRPHGEMKTCPFCSENNEAQAFVCHSCRSLLTLSDMEMILAYNEADQEILRQAVERMEVEDIHRGLESDELVMLAIGHINLKHLRKGLECLQKASKLDPNNVVVESQANSLAIRLAEIEEMESIHSSMPKDRTIMVVDDSATVRKLISGKLEKCGHVVITAVDGMDAMEKLNDVVPDLILLDITMPRMDGYQVCKLIRNNEEMKDVPVVMISGKDGFFDKVRGRMAGTTGYITKPFGPETLMKMLDTYLV